MTIRSRLCSSCSDRYLRMSCSGCWKESTVHLEMLFPPRRCSQFFPSNHGWWCSECFQGVVSIFCLDFMALLRDKKCLSSPLIKINGVQAFRWEIRDLLGNCFYIKEGEKRIDSWSVILLTVMLWGEKLCFCLLSKLLCRFNTANVALRRQRSSGGDPHQTTQSPLCGGHAWCLGLDLCAKECSIGKPATLKAGSCTFFTSL